MPRPDPTAAALQKLALLRDSPDSPQALADLRAALRGRSNFVAAKAAKIAGEARITALLPDLLAASERFFSNPAKLDKTCAALTEIVSALYELEYTEPEIYLRAIHHVQMEGSFGPPVDVAAKLRGAAALGLARTRHPHAMSEIVNVLVDKEVPARLGAVRAVATNGGDAGALLLRLKVLTGDDDPEVLVECFAGLLAQSAEAVSFVAAFADSRDALIAESAILALGASRLPAALEVLISKWERSADAPTRKSLLTAIAANRSDDAAEFLLSLLATERISTATEVLMALAAYRSNERIRAAVGRIVLDRSDKSLLAAYRSDF